jgi:hypothetical protein
MRDLFPYQQRVQLKKMATKSNTHHNYHYWSTTSFSFANKIHPLKNKSYWIAARRALVIFDWVGYGRNRAKNSALFSEKCTTTAKCGLRGQVDSQRRCMLECTHHQFTAIRRTATILHALIAERLMQKYHLSCFKHFIQQICHASLTDATHMERIWLGIWCPDTLKGLLLQSIISEQYIYIEITSKLTSFLMDAYYQMLDINVKSQCCSHYAIDHAPTTLADSDQLAHEPNIAPPLSPTAKLLSPQSRAILEAMHVQEASSLIGSRLSHLNTVISTTLVSISDSAFSLQSTDITF